MATSELPDLSRLDTRTLLMQYEQAWDGATGDEALHRRAASHVGREVVYDRREEVETWP